MLARYGAFHEGELSPSLGAGFPPFNACAFCEMIVSLPRSIAVRRPPVLVMLADTDAANMIRAAQGGGACYRRGTTAKGCLRSQWQADDRQARPDWSVRTNGKSPERGPPKRIP
jgi:hypothetical protein